ncbi:MAG: sulfatase-like hydrolase/transferase [Acidobacteria bacterium]|nr:sulfatase-like hydrolase/transferase [Acidobacteriota bacterium]
MPRSTRREFFARFAGAALSAGALACGGGAPAAARRPNILFCISDDQSYPHTSAYGYPAAKTPSFDRVAREGVLFHNAFAASPGCSPCRAAFLTGRHTWMIENAGTHASTFPAKYLAYPDLLEQAGYHVGYTGKGWGPGNWQAERPRNPAGPEYNEIEAEPPYNGIRKTDYAANFAKFFAEKAADQPFCFWYGASEPHRKFEAGSWQKEGKQLDQAPPPPFLPDRPEIRADILDYAVEIEHFDKHLGRILDQLQQAGELDNTLVIVTSDNGMAFPRAKANCYEYGAHMPLAVRWADRVPGGREVDDLVGFVDLTATILDASGVPHPGPHAPVGKSIRPLLEGGQSGLVEPERDGVYFARERHSSSRYNNWTYPQRALRTHQHLYIRNFAPDRWPAGDPQKFDEPGKLGPQHGGYHDIDDSPSLRFLVENRQDPEIRPFFLLAVDKRPAEELFDIKADPGCLKNLAGAPEHEEVRGKLAARLESYLAETGDARVTGQGDVWESYKRYSPIRSFPEPPETLPEM